ncbi:MAG: dihydroxyacetone kinase subunit DhaK [Floccifex sp.]
MKKFINDPKNFVNEMLEGLYAAYPQYITHTEEGLRSLVIKNKKPGKVGIATGGGSGHLPLFLGYVGKGMLDGCAVGDVFQSPSAEEMLSVTKEIDQGAGVLYIYGNYNGDIFNFTMASEMAEMEEDIEVKQVIAGEDVASGKRTEDGQRNLRRGVAGIVFVYKCAGAVADQMMSLDEVQAVALKTSQQVATMGVALSACTVPMVGHPSFEIGEDEMEIGMGIHGEPGIRRGTIQPADEVVMEMLYPIIDDLKLKEKDEVAVLINGLGATPFEEQFVVNRKIHEILSEKGISIYRTYVGEFATSLEMAGFSISLLKLDDELKGYIDYPVDTPFFKQF